MRTMRDLAFYAHASKMTMQDFHKAAAEAWGEDGASYPSASADGFPAFWRRLCDMFTDMVAEYGYVP